jgi:hypothetical protein
LNTILCRCGHELFYPSTNNEFFMCAKCYAIYDKSGRYALAHSSGGKKVKLDLTEVEKSGESRGCIKEEIIYGH